MSKPTKLDKIWAKNGAIVDPGDTKTELGWVAEIPPYQHFNHQMNKTSQMLDHINTNGIPVWDALTTYELGARVLYNAIEYVSTAASNIGSVPDTLVAWKDPVQDNQDYLDEHINQDVRELADVSFGTVECDFLNVRTIDQLNEIGSPFDFDSNISFSVGFRLYSMCPLTSDNEDVYDVAVMYNDGDGSGGQPTYLQAFRFTIATSTWSLLGTRIQVHNEFCIQNWMAPFGDGKVCMSTQPRNSVQQFRVYHFDFNSLTWSLPNSGKAFANSGGGYAMTALSETFIICGDRTVDNVQLIEYNEGANSLTVRATWTDPSSSSTMYPELMLAISGSNVLFMNLNVDTLRTLTIDKVGYSITLTKSTSGVTTAINDTGAVLTGNNVGLLSLDGDILWYRDEGAWTYSTTTSLTNEIRGCFAFHKTRVCAIDSAGIMYMLEPATSDALSGLDDNSPWPTV